ADVSELNNTKTQSEQFLKPEQKVIVKEEVKPVYVVPPAFPDADKKAMEQAKQDLENDFFIPDVNDNNNIPVKKENEEIKRNGGTVADVPSVTEEAKTLPDAKNEPFVLKQVPQKKYDGTDIILSNVIEEKAGTMENHPLIINKNRDGGKKTDLLIPNENMNEAKVENASVVEPVANVAPTSLVKPVVSSERNDIINSIPVIQRPVAKKTVPQNIVEEKDVLTAHIASYTTRETAERGIEIWKEKYPLITLLKSSIKYENVPEKGMFYRVYLTGSEAKLENLCNQMKSNNDWCNILR
ncbi:MAG: hypothetical protein IJ638_00280, partial [Alphaproteobacteria bacterium]|nr:hypothetical protein [Alphaproteobacteria bacterium]